MLFDMINVAAKNISEILLALHRCNSYSNTGSAISLLVMLPYNGRKINSNMVSVSPFSVDELISSKRLNPSLSVKSTHIGRYVPCVAFEFAFCQCMIFR